MTAPDIIRHLQLLPHPEGGYYRETYRATRAYASNLRSSRIVVLAGAG
ncbi:cupin domain-containing protein [Hymenobacter sp. APR13]